MPTWALIRRQYQSRAENDFSAFRQCRHRQRSDIEVTRHIAAIYRAEISRAHDAGPMIDARRWCCDSYLATVRELHARR